MPAQSQVRRKAPHLSSLRPRRPEESSQIQKYNGLWGGFWNQEDHKPGQQEPVASLSCSSTCCPWPSLSASPLPRIHPDFQPLTQGLTHSGCSKIMSESQGLRRRFILAEKQWEGAPQVQQRQAIMLVRAYGPVRETCHYRG